MEKITEIGLKIEGISTAMSGIEALSNSLNSLASSAGQIDVVFSAISLAGVSQKVQDLGLQIDRSLGADLSLDALQNTLKTGFAGLKDKALGFLPDLNLGNIGETLQTSFAGLKDKALGFLPDLNLGNIGETLQTSFAGLKDKALGFLPDLNLGNIGETLQTSFAGLKDKALGFLPDLKSQTLPLELPALAGKVMDFGANMALKPDLGAVLNTQADSLQTNFSEVQGKAESFADSGALAQKSISIGSLIGELTIKVDNIKNGAQDLKEEVQRALLEAIKDTELAL